MSLGSYLILVWSIAISPMAAVGACPWTRSSHWRIVMSFNRKTKKKKKPETHKLSWQCIIPILCYYRVDCTYSGLIMLHYHYICYTFSYVKKLLIFRVKITHETAENYTSWLYYYYALQYYVFYFIVRS